MAVIIVTEDNSTVYVGNGDIVKIQIPGGGTVTIKADPNQTVTNFKVHFLGDDHSDVIKIDLATFSQDNLDIDIQHYDATDEVQLIGGFNMGVDPVNSDEFDFSYIGATGGTFNGHLTAKDGREKDFNADPNPVVICFAEGTIIDTDLGPRPVESLLIGDFVNTQDHGPQPLRWIGKRRLDSIDLMRHPNLRPIRIGTGALGGGLPYSPLTLSPQHRVQIADWRTEVLFGEGSVLVAVKHLIDEATIAVDTDTPTVCYYHLLFDQHEILWANGAPTESLHPGDIARKAMDTAASAEIHLLFPDLEQELSTRVTAQPVLRSYEAQAICAYAG